MTNQQSAGQGPRSELEAATEGLALAVLQVRAARHRLLAQPNTPERTISMAMLTAGLRHALLDVTAPELTMDKSALLNALAMPGAGPSSPTPGWEAMEEAPDSGLSQHLPPKDLEAFGKRGLSYRGWLALRQLGWFTPALLCNGDAADLYRLHNMGRNTRGEIARLRRRLLQTGESA